MGQYSKFVQPGFVRVAATANPVAGVYISAFDYTWTVPGSLSAHAALSEVETLLREVFCVSL